MNKPLTTNEKATLLVSAAALVMSCVALYVQFFYERVAVKAVVSYATLGADSLRVDVFILNNGSKQLLVTRRELWLEQKDSGAVLISPDSLTTRPLLVDPGKIGIVRIETLLDEALIYANGARPDSGCSHMGVSPRKAYFDVGLDLVTADGQAHSFLDKRFLSVHLTRDLRHSSWNGPTAMVVDALAQYRDNSQENACERLQ
jgi:hypothetical protein